MSNLLTKELSAYLEDAAGNGSILFIGIDPGTSGAIGLLADNQPFVIDIPVSRIDDKRGRSNGVYDLDAIVHIFDVITVHLSPTHTRVCLEQSQAIPGDAPFVAFRCGEGFAMWPLFLRSLHIRVDTVRPAVWKKSYGLLGGATHKEAARLKALSFWPGLEDLRRKKDHNRAEALLLADYLWRQSDNQPKPSTGARKKG